MSNHPFSKKMDFRRDPRTPTFGEDAWAQDEDSDAEHLDLVDPRTLDMEDKLLAKIDLDRAAEGMQRSAAALRALGWPAKEPMRERRGNRLVFHHGE